MFSPSSSNIDLFLDSIPLSPPYFGHETVLLQSYPNYLLDDIPFMEPISTMEDVSNTLAMTSNQENNNIGLQEEHHSPNESTLSKKIQTMKDRHSKINTATGLRERRVRLSLGVAIKFFDLQDMLGFDKASKTIDWLLRKSSSSIEELKKREKSCINGENRDDKSSTSASECKALSDQTNKDPKKKNLRKKQEKKIKQLVKSSLQLQARESRAKARERARERTKGKMATARVSDKTLLHSRLPILNPFDSFNEIEASNERMMLNNAPINEPYPCFRVSEAQNNSTSENSILMKRQFMKPCSNLNVANSSNVTQNQNIMGASAPELQDSKYLEIFREAGNHFPQGQDGVQIRQEMQVVVLLEV